MSSPMHRHTRSGPTSLSNARRPQNTKAAAERLARVMGASQPLADDDDDMEEFDLMEPVLPSSGLGLAGGRPNRNRSPMSARAPVVVQPPSSRSTLRGRASTGDQQPVSAQSPTFSRPSHSRSVEGHSYKTTDFYEEAQPPSARFHTIGGRSSSPITPTEQSRFNTVGRRSSSSITPMEQSPSARYALPSQNSGGKTIPPDVPLPVKHAGETQPEKSREKRLLDFGTFKNREPSDQQSSSALQDELDMLQEENESLLEKLRITEQRFEEAEARTRQLEEQIASVGDGVSSDDHLLSRKEEELQKREAAIKVAEQTYGGGEEIVELRMEAKTAKDEATYALEQLHDVEYEVKSLRTLTKSMILTQEEMEEVILKRCWLARCWSLCVRHDIHSEIAEIRHEYWSSLVSRPVEVILAAGRNASDHDSSSNNYLEEREEFSQNKLAISKKGNVESMLLVEKGLRELTSLKVEEAIAISMAHKRCQSMVKSNTTVDELKLPMEVQKFSEAFELSKEEFEDVLLKQAWLTYFWRRANDYGVEPDIAEERLQFWIKQGNKSLNSHDAVDVERGMIELRKLGIEARLWEETRRFSAS